MQFSVEQLKAIHHMKGPALVLAGPGSGKTAVLTERTVNLINQGADPNGIFVLTFTKNSAYEMEKRFIDKYDACGDVFCIPSFSTIHALACKIIGNSEEKYEIINGTEQAQLLNYVSNEAAKRELVTVTGDKFNKMILNEISNYNNSFNDMLFNVNNCKKIQDNTFIKDIFNAELNKKILSDYKPIILNSSQFVFIYSMYDRILKQRKLITYDDMIKNAINTLSVDDKVLKKFRDMTRYILVDEFQDTDLSQLYMIMLLLGDEKNLFAVGDEDQSIYSFRGANPDIMLMFKDIFPDSCKYYLKNNYRCAKKIVQLSSTLIKNNVKRFNKETIAVRKHNGNFKIIKAEDENSEAVHVLNFIKNIINEEKSTDKSVCVLARTNQGLKRISNLLMAENIDFYLKDKIDNIFEKDVFKLLIIFLKGAADMYDTDSFYIILYIVNIGIKSASVNGNSDVYSNMIKYAAGDDFLIDKINKLREQMEFTATLPPAAAIIFLENQFNISGFLSKRDEYKNVKPEIIKENILFLCRLSSGFSTVKDFLKYVSGYNERIKASYEKSSKPENSRVRITVSTIHSSKGLEYDSVWIMGANEGSIPSRKALTPGATEEERRLFYVAMTRAENNLYISFHNRERGKISKPSRFLKDIDI